MVETIERVVDAEPERVEALLREALARQGFGVLTEIDVAAVLEDKLGVQRPALKILGACKPQFAHEALEAEPTVATVLPCNVVIEAETGRVRLRAADPRAFMTDPGLVALAEQAAHELGRALDEVVAHTIAAP